MQESLRHHCHEFGGQGVGTHQRMQGTRGSVEDVMQHPRNQKLVEHLVHKAQVLHHKMDEGDDILDHINKVKSLADQLTCLEVPIKEGDVVMTLLDSLPPSFVHLITALETRPMNELTLDFITARLMHEVSKRKEKEPQGDDAAMLSRQPRTFDNNERRDNAPRCYNCGKLGHLARNCRSKRKVNANMARSSDDFAFVVRDGASQHLRH